MRFSVDLSVLYNLPEVASAAAVFGEAVAKAAAELDDDAGAEAWLLTQMCGWPLVGGERGRVEAVVGAPVYAAPGPTCCC